MRALDQLRPVRRRGERLAVPQLHRQDKQLVDHLAHRGDAEEIPPDQPLLVHLQDLRAIGTASSWRQAPAVVTHFQSRPAASLVRANHSTARAVVVVFPSP